MKFNHDSHCRLILAALLACAGCTSGTLAIKDESRATVSAKLTQGVSTQDQVQTMFGKPTQVSSSNATTIWQYSYGATQPGVQNFIPGVSIFSQNTVSHGKAMTLVFGQDGILRDYTFTEQNINVHRGI